MNEMYWITRLDSIKIFVFFVIGLCIAFLIFNGVQWQVENDFGKPCKRYRKYAIIIGTIAVILSISMVFIPSTKEAYTIYGVGGVMDYVQDNDTAKQLPDKAIQAFDKLMDEYLEEGK